MTKADFPAPPLRLMAVIALLVLFAAFGQPLVKLIPEQPNMWGPLQNTAISLALFLSAHLLHGLAAARLATRRQAKPPVPKVALDLLRVVLFTIAALISLSLFFRQDLSGILTGSGLLLAVLGFAIRNVVADMFSGLALGLEAPFRIGDWVNIEGLAQGRIREIGWRTTQLVTRDSTYVILPNSQISRQRITNYSAPRQEYRDHVELTLPADLEVAKAKTVIQGAVLNAEHILKGKRFEVQVFEYGPGGITYRVKYWVPRYDREATCRNELFSLIDAQLRRDKVRILPRPVCNCGSGNGHMAGDTRCPPP